MFKKIIILKLIILAILPQPSYANESTGYLQDIFVNSKGLVLFRLTNPVNNRPKCATNKDWDYKLDLSNPYSVKIFDMLKMAELISEPIRVGYGVEPNCGKGFPAINVEYILLVNLHQGKKLGKGNYIVK